jgi:hypothetical protein
MDRIERAYTEEFTLQPPHIPISLYPHQLSSLGRMKELETAVDSGLLIGNERIFSSYGVLGERAGTGKTLTMLAHVSQMTSLAPTQPFNRLHSSSTPSFYSMNRVEPALNTLIVVPHNLYHQWQAEIQRTTLSCTYLRSLKDIDTCVESLSQTHLTLVSNTLLQALTFLVQNTSTWERIVYDEADMIRIPSACIPLPAKMTWLITSRYKNMINANQQVHSHVVKQLPAQYIAGLSPPLQKYISDTLSQHPTLTIFRTASETFFHMITKNNHPLRGHIVVKTEDSALERSLKLPEPVHTLIQCRHAHPRTMELIDKGRIEEGVLSIQPRITTMESLLDGLDANRIERLQIKSCTICYDSADVPCVTPCCMNVFCGRCIVTWITIKNSCPLCKEVIQASTLIKIDTGVRPKKLSKLEALVEYLREVQGQCIIFSRNVQEVYSYIVNNLPSLEDDVDILHGNKTAISNLVADFTKKRIRVLCFSPECVGVDLLSATHVLLMDRLHGEAIERAQRIGRKVPLQVVRFCDWACS